MDVRMPDGTIVANVPDDITQEELQRRFSLYKPEEPKAATAKQEAPVPEVGMPEIEAFNQPGAPKRQLKGSVMEGYEGKQGAALPELPALGSAARKAYDAATPEEREQMAATDPAMAQIHEAYKAREAALPTMLKGQKDIAGLDTRLENRIQDIARKTGAGYDTALQLAKQQIAAEEEGAPKVGEIKETPQAVAEAQEEYGFKPGMRPYEEAGLVLKRALSSGYYGMVQAGGGQVRFLKDMLGMESVADTEANLDDIAMRMQGMGQAPNKPVQYIEGAINSIAQQLPALAAGAITGSEGLVLGSMFLNSFGQTYDESRREGMDIGDSTVRGGAYAALEVLGEKFGLGDTLKGIKAAAKGVPDKDLASYFAKALAKEIPGEELTYAGQFAVDKGFGLNPEAGLKEFIQGAIDTMGVTVLQGGLMMGGGAAANRMVRSLTKSIPELKEVAPTEEEIKKGTPALKTPAAPVAEEQEEPTRRSFRERFTSLLDNWKRAETPVEIAPTQENFDRLVARYESEGQTRDNAVLLANQAIQEAEGVKRAEPGAGEPSVPVSVESGNVPAVGAEAAQPAGLAGVSDTIGVPARGEVAEPSALETTVGAGPVATEATPVAAPITIEKLNEAKINADKQQAAVTRATESVTKATEAVAAATTPEEKKKAETNLKRAQGRLNSATTGAQAAQTNYTTSLEQAPAEVRTAHEQAPPPAPAKRGRPAVLTEEQKKAKLEAGKASKKEKDDAAYYVPKDADLVESWLAGVGVNREDFEEGPEGDAIFREVSNGLAMERNEALQRIYRFQKPNMQGSKYGKEARRVWNRLPPQVKKDVERQAAELGETARSSVPAPTETRLAASTNSETNSQYFKFQNATQAIAWIQKKGNAFERALAARVRPFLTGVKLVIVTDPSQLPDRVRAHFEELGGANGLYEEYQGERIIYLDGSTGVNNTTFLHEAVHGATIARINQFLIAKTEGKPFPRELAEAVLQLENMMVRVDRHFNDLLSQVHAVKPEMQDLVLDMLDFDEIGVFSDIKEFVAYGMTHPRFQEFLYNMPGTLLGEDIKQTNGFSRFVNSIRRILGMGADHESALQDLVALTDKIIGAPHFKGPDVSKVDTIALAKKNKVDGILQKIQRGEYADDVASALGELIRLRSWDDAKSYFQTAFKTLNSKSLQGFLPTLTSAQIIDWVGGKIPHLPRVHQLVEQMNVMRAKALAYIKELSDPWFEYNKKHTEGGKLLSRLMHYTTLTGIDPTLHTDVTAALANDAELQALRAEYAAAPPKSKAAKKGQITKRENRIKQVYQMWTKLGSVGKGEGKLIYAKVKRYYENNFNLHRKILDDRIAASRLEGDINDASTPKGRLMSAIRATYEGKKAMGVYFPLMRYGQYWARFGSGQGREFYMFESEFQRNNFIKKRMQQLRAAGDLRSEEQMREDMDLDTGNDMKALRNQATEGSKMLTEIFGIIDSTQGALDKEALKDSVYQMYLMTMPEQQFRSQFIHRKGTAGFSGDALRNFIRSGYSSAGQLSVLKYSPSILNEMDAADDSLAGNPDKEKLQMFTRELRTRIQDELHPHPDDTIGATLANKANQFTFLWLLTAPKSALINMTAMIVFGVPVLASRYGNVKTAKVMGSYTKVWNHTTFIKESPEGGLMYTPLSIGFSKHVQSNPVLAAAFADAAERGVTEITRTYDLLGMAQTPSEKYTGRFGKISRGMVDFMGSMFHHSERLNREIMYMTAFELAYDKAVEEGLSEGVDGEAYNRAVDEAVKNTYDSMFNYTKFNRPRVMRPALARVALQFRMFPQQVTAYFVRNFIGGSKAFYDAAKNINNPEERDAALSALREHSTQFFGSLLMTGVFAGVTGMPLYSVIVGTIQGLLAALRDDDEFVPFEERDLDYWFRYVWLPETFGDQMANVIARGPVSAVTGVDVAGSTSLNNLWFRDSGDAATMVEGYRNLVASMMGPAGALAENFMKAIEDWNDGHINEAIEKVTPAAFKGAATSVRWSEEGVLSKTQKATLIDKDEVTRSMLFWKSLGFNPNELAVQQDLNFKASSQWNKALKERADIMGDIKVDSMNGNEKRLEKDLERFVTFAIQNPDFDMDVGEVITAIENAEKARARAINGVVVTNEKLRNRAYYLLGNMPQLK